MPEAPKGMVARAGETVAGWFGAIRLLLARPERPKGSILISIDEIVDKIHSDRVLKRLMSGVNAEMGGRLALHYRKLMRDGLQELAEVYNDTIQQENLKRREILYKLDSLERTVASEIRKSNAAQLEKFKTEIRNQNLGEKIAALQKSLEGSERNARSLNLLLEETDKRARMIYQHLHLANIYEIIVLVLGAAIGVIGGSLVSTLDLRPETALAVIATLVFLVLFLLGRSVYTFLHDRKLLTRRENFGFD